jgi:predicted RNA-binding protein with PUA-like domain
MRHWLMKSEPDEFSIDDLVRAKNQTVSWFGVRNYQARNFMRDEMRVGDLAFFYHSSCPEPGIAGIVRISQAAHTDLTQFDPSSDYHDPKSTRANPRWVNVDVTLEERTRLVPLAELRLHPEISDLVILRRGNRLSITPVTPAQWKFIVKLAKRAPPCD